MENVYCRSCPKKAHPVIPNDFRPIALTSHVMKSFEEKNHQNHDYEPHPLQFEYRPGRGMEDAVTTLLNLVVGHLENAKAHARVLYLDMSSATTALGVKKLSLIWSLVLRPNGCLIFWRGDINMFM